MYDCLGILCSAAVLGGGTVSAWCSQLFSVPLALVCACVMLADRGATGRMNWVSGSRNMVARSPIILNGSSATKRFL